MGLCRRALFTGGEEGKERRMKAETDEGGTEINTNEVEYTVTFSFFDVKKDRLVGLCRKALFTGGEEGKETRMKGEHKETQVK